MHEVYIRILLRQSAKVVEDRDAMEGESGEEFISPLRKNQDHLDIISPIY